MQRPRVGRKRKGGEGKDWPGLTWGINECLTTNTPLALSRDHIRSTHWIFVLSQHLSWKTGLDYFGLWPQKGITIIIIPTRLSQPQCRRKPKMPAQQGSEAVVMPCCLALLKPGSHIHLTSQSLPRKEMPTWTKHGKYFAHNHLNFFFKNASVIMTFWKTSLEFFYKLWFRFTLKY